MVGTHRRGVDIVFDMDPEPELTVHQRAKLQAGDADVHRIHYVPRGRIHRSRDPDAHSFHDIASQDFLAAQLIDDLEEGTKQLLVALAGGAAERVQNMVVAVDGDGLRFGSADVHADPHGPHGRLNWSA